MKADILEQAKIIYPRGKEFVSCMTGSKFTVIGAYTLSRDGKDILVSVKEREYKAFIRYGDQWIHEIVEKSISDIDVHPIL